MTLQVAQQPRSAGLALCAAAFLDAGWLGCHTVARALQPLMVMRFPNIITCRELPMGWREPGWGVQDDSLRVGDLLTITSRRTIENHSNVVKSNGSWERLTTCRIRDDRTFVLEAKSDSWIVVLQPV